MPGFPTTPAARGSASGSARQVCRSGEVIAGMFTPADAVESAT